MRGRISASMPLYSANAGLSAATRSARADAAAGEGRVHAGFQDAYASVRKQLISHLIKLRTKYERMWRHVEVEISGHSLGGALSTLAAVELEALGFRVASVSTFGSPRVGDQVFASFIGCCGQPVERASEMSFSESVFSPSIVGVVAALTGVNGWFADSLCILS